MFKRVFTGVGYCVTGVVTGLSTLGLFGAAASIGALILHAANILALLTTPIGIVCVSICAFLSLVAGIGILIQSTSIKNKFRDWGRKLDKWWLRKWKKEETQLDKANKLISIINRKTQYLDKFLTSTQNILNTIVIYQNGSMSYSSNKYINYLLSILYFDVAKELNISHWSFCSDISNDKLIKKNLFIEINEHLYEAENLIAKARSKLRYKDDIEQCNKLEEKLISLKEDFNLKHEKRRVMKEEIKNAYIANQLYKESNVNRNKIYTDNLSIEAIPKEIKSSALKYTHLLDVTFFSKADEKRNNCKKYSEIKNNKIKSQYHVEAKVIYRAEKLIHKYFKIPIIFNAYQLKNSCSVEDDLYSNPSHSSCSSLESNDTCSSGITPNSSLMRSQSAIIC
jgi:hypothetical protein